MHPTAKEEGGGGKAKLGTYGRDIPFFSRARYLWRMLLSVILVGGKKGGRRERKEEEKKRGEGGGW